MSGNNIIRLILDNSNVRATPKQVSFDLINSHNFVDNASDYEVYVEKSEIPFPKTLPFLVSGSEVRIVLEATDKVDKDPIFGEDLFKVFTLQREYRDLRAIASAINEVIYNQLGSGYQWARLTTDDNKILSLVVTNSANAGKTKIWIDSMFHTLFEELPRFNEDTNLFGNEYFELVSLKETDHTYKPTNSYITDIFNLKSFRFYTSLPSEPTWLYEQVPGTMVKSSLIGEVVYNSKEMTGNTNLLYIPNVFRHSSLTDAGPIARFQVTCSAYYFNGHEIPLTMDRNTYFSMTITFVRKIKI